MVCSDGASNSIESLSDELVHPMIQVVDVRDLANVRLATSTLKRFADPRFFKAYFEDYRVPCSSSGYRNLLAVSRHQDIRGYVRTITYVGDRLRYEQLEIFWEREQKRSIDGNLVGRYRALKPQYTDNEVALIENHGMLHIENFIDALQRPTPDGCRRSYKKAFCLGFQKF